ncbi:tryptorubin family RiPP precursor [Kitasatospora humi]
MEMTEMKMLFAIRNTISGKQSLKKATWYLWY